MSHSFDSTLLQRMGFKDPDRKTPEHDRASLDIASRPGSFLRVNDVSDFNSPRVELEVPLQKGDGKYASTVGFIDAVLTFGVPSGEDTRWWAYGREMSWGYTSEPRHETRDVCPSYGKGTGNYERCQCSRDVFPGACPRTWSRESWVIEIKTQIGSIGDLLRQMNLYREYKTKHNDTRVTKFVIWSLSVSDASYFSVLSSQGYDLVVGDAI